MLTAPVRDDGYDRVSALRAIEAMLDMARTGADDICAHALVKAIEDAKSVAVEEIRRSEH